MAYCHRNGYFFVHRNVNILNATLDLAVGRIERNCWGRIERNHPNRVGWGKDIPPIEIGHGD